MRRLREKMGLGCAKEGSGWILGKLSSQKRLSRIRTGCPERWQNPHPWRYLKTVQTWCWGMWCSGSSLALRVGLWSLGEWLDLMIPQVSSNLMCSMTPQKKNTYEKHWLCRHFLVSHRDTPLLPQQTFMFLSSSDWNHTWLWLLFLSFLDSWTKIKLTKLSLFWELQAKATSHTDRRVAKMSDYFSWDHRTAGC